MKNSERFGKALATGMGVRLRYNGKLREGKVEKAFGNGSFLVLTDEGHKTFSPEKVEGTVDLFTV